MMRFFLIGFMGSGKTHWARRWSSAYGLKCYDLDEEIEKREQKSISELFKTLGEDGFRKKEQAALQTYMQLDDFIMSCGGGTPCFFDNMQRMNRAGVTIYLQASAAELAGRLKFEKEARPLIRNVADEVLESFIETKLQERHACYAQAMYHFQTRFLQNENFERIYTRYAK